MYWMWLLIAMLWAEDVPELNTTAPLRSQRVEQLGPVKVGEPFPSFGGIAITGERWTLSEHSSKVLIVSYMASWCEPCRVGLPIIERVATESEDVTAVYVAIGEKSAVPIHRLREELSLSHPILWDKFQLFGQRHGVVSKGTPAALPKTFIIGADGRVQAIFITEGADFESQLQQIITSGAVQ